MPTDDAEKVRLSWGVILYLDGRVKYRKASPDCQYKVIQILQGLLQLDGKNQEIRGILEIREKGSAL